MADYYQRDDRRRRTRERQHSRDYLDFNASYPFNTYSASNSSGGSSRHYGSSSDGSRGRRSTASSAGSSIADPYFQDTQPRYDRRSSKKPKSTSSKALDRILPMAVPVLEGILAKVGVQEGDIYAYIDAFKYPPMPKSRSRSYSGEIEDIDITIRLQAVGKLVLKNHSKDIQQLMLSALLSKVGKIRL